jgi:ribonuclease R
MKKPGRERGRTPEFSRDAVLEFLAQNPSRAAKRDIAKHFNLHGDQRIVLKALLRELEDDGALTRQGVHLVHTGALPTMLVLDVTGRDEEGGLVGRPAQWDEAEKGPAPAIRIVQPRTGKAPTAGVGQRILARIFPPSGAHATHSARPVKVIDLRRDAVLGVLRVLPDGSMRVEATERRDSEFIIGRDDAGSAKHGDLVEIAPAGQPRFGLPRAKVVGVIGSLTSEKAVSMIALHAHGIPHVFPDDVLREAEDLQPVPSRHREDWQSLPFITIDPSDAKDHDDAVHAAADPDPANDGGWIVSVAIADVAACVKPGTALDSEAAARGNSTYFPDRVVPMLPEAISNDACSLREGEPRSTLVARMRFAADGRKIAHSFHRAIIRSAAKLSYQAAQAAIDGNPDDKARPLVETVLRPLWAAYGALKRGRDNRQPLELDLPERKIRLDADGKVAGVIVPERLDAHRLIEEFMIQANVAAAESLERKSRPLPFRVHDVPPLAKQEVLRTFLKTIGLSLAHGPALTPSKLNGILQSVAATEKQDMVNEIMLRSQSQAVYSPDNIGHFGLNLKRYAHFTSPIRRYADLVVHRALIDAHDLGEGGVDTRAMSGLQEVCETISMTERRSAAAERDTVDRLIAGHLAERIGAVFPGRITGVTKSGLFVMLDDFGADGFVPIRTLGEEYFHYDEGAQMLAGSRTGTGFRLADRVEVKLVDAQPLAGSMTFEMVSKPTKLQGVTMSRHKQLSSKKPYRPFGGGGRKGR